MNIMVCDCGTSTCRVLVREGDTGRLLGKWSESVGTELFSRSQAEVDLERLWGLVSRLLRAATRDHSVDVVGVSTFFGYAFLDRHGYPVGGGSTWNDHRAEAAARLTADRIGDEQIAALTGRRLTGELLIPKLMRMSHDEPERFKNVVRVIGIKDEIVHRLTGEIGTDFAHADYSGGFSPWKRTLIPELWEAAGLDPRLLPYPDSAVERAGSVCRAAALSTGLSRGTPVVRGTSDGSAAMYGCGVMTAGTGALVSGTTDVLMVSVPRGSDSLTATFPGLTVNTAMVGDGTLAGGAMGFSGGTAAWIASLTGRGLEELTSLAETVPAGAEGLMMMPSLTGERSPFWRPDLRGAWFGIDPNHGPGHLFRSCLEGNAVRTALLADRLQAAGVDISSLSVGGGGARSRLWNQIRADVTGMGVSAPDDPEATGRGCALLCLPGLNGEEVNEERFAELSRRWMEPVRHFAPDPAAHERYRGACRRYERAVQVCPEKLRSWS